MTRLKKDILKIKKKTITPNKESLDSMRSWVRKLEQTTNSITSRLAAVEKRLSSEKHSIRFQDASCETLKENEKNNSESKTNTLEQFSEDIAAGFTDLSNEIDLLKDTLTAFETRFIKQDDESQHQTAKIISTERKLDQMETDLHTRLERIERREPPMVHIGRYELPIEVTGIIGGILAFVVAACALSGHLDIITSPLFLAVVGCIFLISALAKTISTSHSTKTTFRSSKDAAENI